MLDETGATDGLPFMPEMLKFLGTSTRVIANLDRVCDTVNPVSIRCIPEAVVLDDLRCDGSGHAGCQAECRIFWKTSWLRPATDSRPLSQADDAEAYAELERIALANAGNHAEDLTEATFRCQHTDLPAAGRAVGWRDLRSFLHQLTSGNVRLLRFVRVTTRAVLVDIGRQLRLVRRVQFMPQNPPDHVYAPPPPRGLMIGQSVRVRSKKEIAETLTPNSKHKGLRFDQEMLAYCGKTARVRAKVERFVDEKTGKLVVLSSDCYILEGCICRSDVSYGRWFCPRGIFAWWRECWLEVVDSAGPAGSDAVSRGSASQRSAAASTSRRPRAGEDRTTA